MRACKQTSVPRVLQTRGTDFLNGHMLKPEVQSAIESAAAILRKGGVVALPTETVYGLAADASNPDAIKRIFTIKGRPADHPLIVHIADKSELNYWASDVPESAQLLASHFWPGPLTLILHRSPHVSNSITGGQDTVGLRIPNHPLTLDVLRAMGPHAAVAAPSANRYGRISPTTAAHVKEELGNNVDYILDGGPCQVGLESTIVSCISDKVTILRPGGIPVSAIEAVLKHSVEVVESSTASIRVSGSVLSHYAPRTPLELLPHKELLARAQTLTKQGVRVATLEWSAPDEVNSRQADFARTGMPNNAAEYGQQLYATLRQLDNEHFDRLLAETPPATSEWLAVTDRLLRASYQK
jgi:L-threonylcarbamoyladenylate synthase